MRGAAKAWHYPLLSDIVSLLEVAVSLYIIKQICPFVGIFNNSNPGLKEAKEPRGMRHGKISTINQVCRMLLSPDSERVQGGLLTAIQCESMILYILFVCGVYSYVVSRVVQKLMSLDFC